MSRSLKKGPYVDERLLGRIIALPAGDKSVLRAGRARPPFLLKWSVIL